MYISSLKFFSVKKLSMLLMENLSLGSDLVKSMGNKFMQSIKLIPLHAYIIIYNNKHMDKEALNIDIDKIIQKLIDKQAKEIKFMES